MTDLLKNKGTLPCDRCGRWTILKPYENRLLLCDDCLPKQQQDDSYKYDELQLVLERKDRNDDE